MAKKVLRLCIYFLFLHFLASPGLAWGKPGGTGLVHAFSACFCAASDAPRVSALRFSMGTDERQLFNEKLIQEVKKDELLWNVKDKKCKATHLKEPT